MGDFIGVSDTDSSQGETSLEKAPVVISGDDLSMGSAVVSDEAVSAAPLGESSPANSLLWHVASLTSLVATISPVIRAPACPVAAYGSLVMSVALGETIFFPSGFRGCSFEFCSCKSFLCIQFFSGFAKESYSVV